MIKTYLSWNTIYYRHQTDVKYNHVIIIYDYSSQNIPVLKRMNENKELFLRLF